MFLLDWLYGIFAFLGLYPKEATILVWGRDNDANTHLHNWLRNRDLIQKDPSIGKIKFKALESGGHLISSRLWRDYYVNFKIDAVVYLLDVGYMLPWKDEMRNELDRLLEDNSLANVPVLIFVYSSEEVSGSDEFGFRLESYCRKELGLTTTGKGKVNLADAVRPIEIFTYDIHNQTGYCRCGGLWDGFRWLSQYIR